MAAVETEPAAQAEWQRLARRMPDLLGERRPVLQRLDRDGRTFWRVRTGGFVDIAEATGFCTKVRAKGAACTIASF
ncbi:MAG: SPOR domain-containing protein [Gemmatimonadaceae bacterium]|nr:SPOR domain-containing protein [Acetobacteraceae bacterium]